LDLGPGEAEWRGRYAEYLNVPRGIGAVVSARLATLAELDSVLGSEDLYMLLEIISVDAHNERVAARAAGGRG
jgi:hypothetical protein